VGEQPNVDRGSAEPGPERAAPTDALEERERELDEDAGAPVTPADARDVGEPAAPPDALDDPARRP
jgi:hypothetical protein